MRVSKKFGRTLVMVAALATVLTTAFAAVAPHAALAADARCSDPKATFNTAVNKCTVPTINGMGGSSTCPTGYDKEYSGGVGICTQDPIAAAPTTPPTGTTNQNQDDDSPTISCEILSANPINWFICPIVTGLQESVNGLNNAIDAMMTIDASGGSGSVFNDKFHNAWGQFRLIGLGIVIIAGLVMIASQAFGLEIVDALTVRRVLPRLVIAVIFITISWPLMKFVIVLTNDVGNSIRAIIYSPFKADNNPIALSNWTTFVAALVGGAAITTMGIAALASFVVTAALAVLVGFLTLLIRQLVIMFLVIVSPLAIACYVLPNTQKAFNFWKDTLISLLLMFPIVSALIAIGRVFALVAYNQ